MILRGIKERYESHHRVRIADTALIAAVQLASDHIPDRFLPDKAIDLVDEAASQLKLELDRAARLPYTELPRVSREIEELEARLQVEDGRRALMRDSVVAADIEAVAAMWTGLSIDVLRSKSGNSS